VAIYRYVSQELHPVRTLDWYLSGNIRHENFYTVSGVGQFRKIAHKSLMLDKRYFMYVHGRILE